MRKLNKQRQGYLIIICGLASLVLVTSLSGIAYYTHTLRDINAFKAETNSNDNSKYSDQKKASNKKQSPSSSKTSELKQSSSPTRSPINKPSHSKKSDSSSTDNAKQTSNPSVNVSVDLSVNSNHLGRVVLKKGDNQCSVLSKALSAGLIESLDMHYSSQYKTMAVYVIDGIGEPNQIWWTYTVNGKPPPFGCSKMPVSNGDRVNWNYVK